MSELITSLSNATDKLMKLQMDKQKVIKDKLDDGRSIPKETKTPTIGNIENAVFVSDSDTLCRQMKEENKGEMPYIIDLDNDNKE